MADRITGIKALHEISLTRKAANGSCTKVLRKNLEGGTAQIIHEPGQSDPAIEEESVMDLKIMKSFAGLTARVGATAGNYVAQMEDDKVKSFFEQEAAAQDAEVKAWDDAEKAKALAASEAEKAKNAKDPTIAALEDKVKSLEATATAEKAKARDAELTNIAKSQYGAVPKALDVLKSIEGLPDVARQPVLDNLKAQQEMAKNFGTTFGDNEAGEGSATAKYEAVVAEVAKTKNVTKAAAMVIVAEDPAHAELVQEHRAELAG